MCLIRFTISFFHESSSTQPFLNGYAISSKSTCNQKLCIYHEFNRYVYLRRYVFQRSTCSHTRYCVSFLKQAPAVIISFFKDIELIRKSSCSHPFDELPFFYYKRVIAATHSFKFTVFLKNKNSKEISLILIMIPSWFQAYIYWKQIVIWWHHFRASIFSTTMLLFHRSTWSDSYVKDTVYFTTPVATFHYNKRCVDSRKIEGYVYLRKTIAALLIYRCLFIPHTSCLNFCLKSTVLNRIRKIAPPPPIRKIVRLSPNKFPLWVKVRVRVRGNLPGGNFPDDHFPCSVLNARKHLQSSHSLMVNVLIWQFHNGDCSYLLCTVNFLEVQL